MPLKNYVLIRFAVAAAVVVVVLSLATGAKETNNMQNAEEAMIINKKQS